MIPRSDRPTGWIEHAACKGRDMLLTTHTMRMPYYLRRYIDRERMLVCARCPVLTECTEWVFDHLEDPCPFHIVAGLPPVERGAIRRKMRAAR